MTYRRAFFLADVLRAAGLTVVEFKDWKKRGRPESTGGFDPRGIILHHDASAPGPSPHEDTFIAVTGRPPKVPAPLAHCWVDTKGTWHVLASGRTNHAGEGKGFGRIPKDSGNTYAIGVETDHTKKENWFPGQLEAVKLGFAALADAMSIDPMRSICGHKEYAPDRKIDPSRTNMDDFRRDVAELMRPMRSGRGHPPPQRLPKPPTTLDLAKIIAAAHADPGHPGHKEHPVQVTVVQKALVAEGKLTAPHRVGAFDIPTKNAYGDWQRSLGFHGGTADDGIPGWASLTKLGHRNSFGVTR
jgi:hypothetical protein